MAELWALPAGELARLVGAREVSSREVVQAHLTRIAEVNPHVNAITVVLDEQALEAADAADRALRDGAAPGLPAPRQEPRVTVGPSWLGRPSTAPPSSQRS